MEGDTKTRQRSTGITRYFGSEWQHATMQHPRRQEVEAFHHYHGNKVPQHYVGKPPWERLIPPSPTLKFATPRNELPFDKLPFPILSDSTPSSSLTLLTLQSISHPSTDILPQKRPDQQALSQNPLRHYTNPKLPYLTSSRSFPHGTTKSIAWIRTRRGAVSTR